MCKNFFRLVGVSLLLSTVLFVTGCKTPMSRRDIKKPYANQGLNSFSHPIPPMEWNDVASAPPPRPSTSINVTLFKVNVSAGGDAAVGIQTSARPF